MVKVYLQSDADLDLIKRQPVSVIGYGNQGRSQALNLRNNGLSVTIGNIDDEYAAKAKVDGFQVCSIEQVAKAGEVILVLIPDEVAAEVYHRDIHGALAEGDVLSFASGYNVMYGHIAPPAFVDLILVAPRMGGPDVRERYVAKQGFVSLVSAGQDHSGHAFDIAVALAMGIGSTLGALTSTFEEETIVDLFGEQLQGMALATAQLAFEVMVEAGCSPEASLLELYMSDEVSDDWRNCTRIGLWKQLRGHSTTSQYGQLTRGPLAAGEDTRAMFNKVMDDVKSGSFDREWMAEQKSGLVAFKTLVEQSLSHPLNKAEDKVRQLLKQPAQ